MNFRVLLLLALSTSCSRPNETTQAINYSPVDVDKQSAPANAQIFSLKELRDTTLNGVTLSFTELTDKDYNTLLDQTKETGIPLQPASGEISKVESCLLVKLDNGRTDSLCNKKQGDYFEGYEINGIWKENGLVLASYQDWEGGSDFYINLKDGGHYYLTNNYKVSPDLKHILSYVDLNETVFMPSGLMLTQCGNRTIATKLNIEFERVIITSLSWLTNDQCLITAGTWDSGNMLVNDLRNYKLTLGL